MQIVIDIPDEKSENLIKQMKLDRNFRECKIIELPKEHGRLIDADALKISEDYDGIDAMNAIYSASTLVEADKTGRE